MENSIMEAANDRQASISSDTSSSSKEYSTEHYQNASIRDHSTISSRRQLSMVSSTRSLLSIKENRTEEEAEEEPRQTPSKSPSSVYIAHQLQQPSLRNISSNSKSGLSASALSVTGPSASGLSRMAFMSSKEALQVLGSNFQLNNVVPEEEEEEELSTTERCTLGGVVTGELRSRITSHSNIMNRSGTNLRSLSQIQSQELYRRSPLRQPLKSATGSDDDGHKDDDDEVFHSGFPDRHSVGSESELLLPPPSVSIVVRSSSGRRGRRSNTGTPQMDIEEDFPAPECSPVNKLSSEKENVIEEGNGSAASVEEVVAVDKRQCNPQSRRDLRRVGPEPKAVIQDEPQKLDRKIIIPVGEDNDSPQQNATAMSSTWSFTRWIANIWKRISGAFKKREPQCLDMP
ncbi:hypothetical protein BDR26DRAFT_851804 [Obelidium mucronatum]|nr:hypothetical protein BDR26DRAFT_851804 [Obelidium mucronatum]